jgi:hypothetical protein
VIGLHHHNVPAANSTHVFRTAARSLADLMSVGHALVSLTDERGTRVRWAIVPASRSVQQGNH